MRRTSPPEPNLQRIVSSHRIIVCAGAGGVGKTTLAATIAVRAAREGKRVVCLTIDPARRLADSLGVPPSLSPSEIKDISHVLGNNRRGNGALSFGMLEPRKTFAEIVHRRASSPEAAERILSNKLYRYVSGSLSGMHEYMALEQLAAIRDNPQHELIVLDTPPTTNAIDFFTAPRRMIEALDGKFVRIMRKAYGGAPRIGLDLWSRWTSALFKVISRFTGKELLTEMMAFIDALSDLFGSFSERAVIVENVLHGPEVAFCLITTPDQATLRETRNFRDRLSELGLAVDAIVFNCAHWPKAPDPPADLPRDISAPLSNINAKWNQLFAAEEEFIGRVKNAWEEIHSVVIVPRLPEGANRIESLLKLGDYL